MSVQNKLRTSTEYSTEVDETRERFADYAAAFAADVERKRRERAEPLDVSAHRARIDAAADEFVAARTAMERYRAEFAASAATTLDVSGFLAAVEQFHDAVADRRAEWAAYGDAFAADVDRKQAAWADYSAGVQSYREAFLGSDVAAAVRRRQAPQRDESEAAAGTAGTDTAGGPGDTEPAMGAEPAAGTEDAVDTETSEESPDPSAVAAETDDPEPITTETTATTVAGDESGDAGAFDEDDAAADDFEEGEAFDDAGADTDVEDDIAAEEFENGGDAAGEFDDDGEEFGDGDDVPEDAGEEPEFDDREESESMDEVARAHGEADDAGALVAELEELPYGTLKKAANALGYEDDLNSATKDDLIAFFSEKDTDEIRAALEE